MTKDEALKLKRYELDAAVAEKVMKWVIHSRNSACYVNHGEENSAGDSFTIQEFIEQWSPSVDIADAWRVVERLQSLLPGGDIHIEHLDGFWNVSTCYQDGEWKKWTEAKTAPEAICKAALLAVLDTQ